MIHQYKLGGYNIVLDVCSGAVHMVDDVAYDVIGMYETKSKDEIAATILKEYPDVGNEELEELYEDLEEMRENGTLFTEDTYK